jgi:microcin C transport system substrate-binding protein
VFQNSDMMATGKPGPEELALLEPFRGRVPEEVFGEPFVPPVSDGSGQDRSLLRKASQILQDAGLPIKDRMRVDVRGAPFTVEFLIDDPGFQPHHMPFIKNLATLGIDATLRMVDPVQFRSRLQDFDFDITILRMNFEINPGDSLRPYFSSRAAATPGSNNLAGIADPVVDTLIEKIIAAENRPDLVFACRALDRVLRCGRYWVPQWFRSQHLLAYWDVLDHPATNPRYALGAPETWWYDPAKAARLERPG